LKAIEIAQTEGVKDEGFKESGIC